MLYSWAAFWLTFFIGGSLFYNHRNAKTLPNTHVSDDYLHQVVATNALISLFFIPFTEFIPTLIFVSNTFYGYLLRLFLALLIGETIFYTSHRLLHHPKLYYFHKLHHTFSTPHPMAGLYASPLEYFVANHLSMVIPLKIISCYHPWLLVIESTIVSLNILKSHSGHENFAAWHQRHHDLNHYSNFGFSYLFDILLGTS